METLQLQATEWLHAQEAERLHQDVAVDLWYARLAAEDDERVAAGQPSEIPVGARAVVDARRMSPERLARRLDPEYAAKRNQRRQEATARRAAAKRQAEALLSDPDTVALLVRILEREREAEQQAADLKVAV
jgi:hypothetical protein